jgi:hypothetical protein
MSMTPKKRLGMAVLATAVLALAAMGPMVDAKDPERPERRGPDAEKRQEKGEERRADAERGGEGGPAAQRGHGREGVRERMQAEYQRHCADPANETVAERCEKMAEKMEKEHKARRHAHALLGAIAAHERILGRIEYKITKAEARLAEGNLTGNQTEALEMRIEKLEAMKERQVAKIDELQAKLEQLKARWEAARERAGDEGEPESGEETGTTSPPADGNGTADP